MGIRLTFRRYLEYIAESLGRAGSSGCDFKDPLLRLEAISVLKDYYTRTGLVGKWCLCTKDGCITLPKGVGTIIKVKTNDEVGFVESKWDDFFAPKSYFIKNSDDFNCFCKGDDGLRLSSEANIFPTAYDLSVPSYINIETGVKCTDELQYVIIQGLDEYNQEVSTLHKGELVRGEKLTPSKNEIIQTKVKFSKITNIIKSVTDDFIIFTSQKDLQSPRMFLSVMSPMEEVGTFKRIKISGITCDCNVTILAYLDTRDDYHDNDIITVENINTLKMLASSIQSLINNNINAAAAKSMYVDKMIEEQAKYEKTGDSTFNINIDTSFGGIDRIRRY